MFMIVKDNPSIYINKLYGEYGLALVELNEEKSNKANDKSEKVMQASKMLQETEDEVYKRSKSNMLLKLVNQYKQKNGIE